MSVRPTDRSSIEGVAGIHEASTLPPRPGRTRRFFSAFQLRRRSTSEASNISLKSGKNVAPALSQRGGIEEPIRSGIHQNHSSAQEHAYPRKESVNRIEPALESQFSTSRPDLNVTRLTQSSLPPSKRQSLSRIDDNRRYLDGGDSRANTVPHRGVINDPFFTRPPLPIGIADGGNAGASESRRHSLNRASQRPVIDDFVIGATVLASQSNLRDKYQVSATQPRNSLQPRLSSEDSRVAKDRPTSKAYASALAGMSKQSKVDQAHTHAISRNLNVSAVPDKVGNDDDDDDENDDENSNSDSDPGAFKYVSLNQLQRRFSDNARPAARTQNHTLLTETSTSRIGRGPANSLNANDAKYRNNIAGGSVSKAQRSATDPSLQRSQPARRLVRKSDRTGRPDEQTRTRPTIVVSNTSASMYSHSRHSFDVVRPRVSSYRAPSLTSASIEWSGSSTTAYSEQPNLSSLDLKKQSNTVRDAGRLSRQPGDFFSSEHALYQCYETLGKGPSAIIEKVQESSTGKVYARKTYYLNSHSTTQTLHQRWREELRAMDLIGKHQHLIIVRTSYLHIRNLVIVIEPVASKGDLAQYLSRIRDRQHALPAEDKHMLFRTFGCLASGLNFLHQKGIRHKDIRPQNILLHEGRVIYTHFAIFRTVSNPIQSGQAILAGSYADRYDPPETRQQISRNRKSDIWCLGCVYMDILSALYPTYITKQDLQRPFVDNLDKTNQVLHFCERANPLTRAVGELCRSMLTVSRAFRPTADQLVESFTDAARLKALIPGCTIGQFICKHCISERSTNIMHITPLSRSLSMR